MCINLLTEPSEFSVARVAPGPLKKDITLGGRASITHRPRVCAVGAPRPNGPPPVVVQPTAAAQQPHRTHPNTTFCLR